MDKELATLGIMQPVMPADSFNMKPLANAISRALQTGHFSGVPGSLRFTRAGSVGMVRIFFATDSGSSRRAMVLPYDLDIFWPSSPGMRGASVSSTSGSTRIFLPPPSSQP